MFIKLKITLIILISLFFTKYVSSQAEELKFGKVSIEELQMKVYDLDTSSVAVILYEKGFYQGFSFTIHRRIKILKKEGLNQANSIFRTYSKSTIKGITFNYENGEIVESKLENENIFAERIVENYYVYNVAMPDVKVGSIIDIKVSHGGLPYVWYFQHSIPVIKSECEIGDVQYVSFRKQMGGIIQPKEVGFNHWLVENMPAFISEPYSNSDKNYLSRIEFDISGTNYPNQYHLNIAHSWKDVELILLKSSQFGEVIDKQNVFLNKYAREIRDSASSDLEKAKLAVEKVKSIAEWNGISEFYISQLYLNEVEKKHSGNSADLNIMLICLLKKLDIEVFPVVLSTRDNGMLHPINPTIRKLNYVLAYARIDGQFMYLDATNRKIPFDMLPIQCLNYYGQMINGYGTEKVFITPNKRFIKKIYYSLNLNEDLSLQGNMSIKSKDYAALEFRDEFKEFVNSSDFVDNKMSKNSGLTINDFTIENVENPDSDINEKYDVEIGEAFTVIGNQLFLNMFLFDKMEENPFKSEERKYPVDYSYERYSSGVVRIILPENFTVVELPKAISLNLPENSAKFTMIYQLSNNVLTLNYKIAINRVVFGEKDYPNVKEFFAQVVNNQNIPIVININ